MDRMEKNGKDDAQKLKIIFLSIATLVTILLIWSLYAANKARLERDAAKQDMEMAKQDSAKLEQMVKDQNQEIDALKKQLLQCEAKAKAKPAAKKKTPRKSKKSSKSKNRH